MEANLYDQPAQAKFLNTYVPIDFNELYRVGSTQKEAVEKAQTELGSQLQKWSEFYSPSARDTQSYYDLTIKKLAPTIQEMASNSDLLKSAEGRAKLQSMINSVDYQKLGQLKQSREGLLQRQQINQKLMLEGKYNPNWHKVNFTDYDTLDPTQGVFNDLSPLAYKSEVDLVKPYVDNLKASFIENRGGFEYSGVSTERTDQELMKMENLSSIQNTPEYAKHMEVLMSQGLTPEQAENQLNNTLLTAGREFAYQTRERDPWWMRSMELQHKEAMAAKKATKYERDKYIDNLTTLLDTDSKKSMLNRFSGLPASQLNKIISGEEQLTPELKQKVDANMDPNVIRSKVKKGYDDIVTNTGKHSSGINYVLDIFSNNISPTASDIYSKTGASEQITSNTYRANNSRNFLLADRLAYSILGTSRSNEIAPHGYSHLPRKQQEKAVKETISRDKFKNDWESGEKFTDFIIKGETKQVTDGDNLYHLKYAYIPVEQFSGYTEEELKNLGGTKVTMKEDVLSENAQYDYEGELVKTTSNTKHGKKEYMRVQVATEIPKAGEQATAADNLYSKKTMSISSKLQDQQVEQSQDERI